MNRFRSSPLGFRTVIAAHVPTGKTAKVYYIDGDRTVDMNAVFANGKMTFTTSHFSKYAVVFEDTKDPAKDPDSGSGKGEFPI